MDIRDCRFSTLSEITITHFYGVPVVAVGIYDNRGVIAILNGIASRNNEDFRRPFEISFFEIDRNGYCDGSQTSAKAFKTEAEALAYVKTAMSSEDMGLVDWEFRVTTWESCAGGSYISRLLDRN